MTAEWIRNHLPLNQGGHVILGVSDFGSVYSVAVEDLANVFAGIEPTYEALIAHDAAHNLGYREAIERWRAEGRI